MAIRNPPDRAIADTARRLAACVAGLAAGKQSIYASRYR